MLGFILGFILFATGFFGGYGLRAWISHRRRHPSRRRKYEVHPARL